MSFWCSLLASTTERSLPGKTIESCMLCSSGSLGGLSQRLRNRQRPGILMMSMPLGVMAHEEHPACCRAALQMTLPL